MAMRRRVALVFLLALVLTAVASPACLAAAAPPAPTPSPTHSGSDPCHSPHGGYDACPHHEQMQAEAVAVHPDTIALTAIHFESQAPRAQAGAMVPTCVTSEVAIDPGVAEVPLRL